MKISILGASGSVGAPTSFNIAVSGLADELVMVAGKRQNILEHHATDIGEAASAAGCKVRHGGFEDLTDSDIIINAAGAHLPLHLGRPTVIQEQVKLTGSVVDKIKKNCPKAIVISAINPVDATNYATYLSGGFDRNKLIGYSINDTIRFRISLARELKKEVSRVECAVIGEHGPTQVPLFSSAKVDGKPVQLTDEMKGRIRAGMWSTIKKYESLNAGRTAGWTCAVGLTTLVRAIAEEGSGVFPCSMVLNGEYGLHDLSMGVPVKLGREGAKEIVEYSLTKDEQEGLKKTADTLKSVSALVRENLNI